MDAVTGIYFFSSSFKPIMEDSFVNWFCCWCCCCASRCQGSNTSTTSADWGISDGSQSVTGEVELALAYHDITSCLQVTVGGCRNISNGKKKKCNLWVLFFILHPLLIGRGHIPQCSDRPIECLLPLGTSRSTWRRTSLRRVNGRPQSRGTPWIRSTMKFCR